MTIPAGAGGLSAFTAEWLPTPEEVRYQLVSRLPIFNSSEGWDDVAIQAEISARGGSLNAELPEVLAERLWQVAHDYVLFSTCSVLDERLAPEQGGPGSFAASLDQRAGAELTRLRLTLKEDASGQPADFSGSVPLSMPSIRRDRFLSTYRRWPYSRRSW